MNFIPLLLCFEFSDPARRRLHGRLVAACSAAGILVGLFAFGFSAIFLAGAVAAAYMLRGLAAGSATRLRAAVEAWSAAALAGERESSAINAAAISAAKLKLACATSQSLDVVIRRRLALRVGDENLTSRFLPIPRPSWRGWED